MAELAPMPTANVRIATAVKAGFFFSIRSAYFKSCRNVCIVAVLRSSPVLSLDLIVLQNDSDSIG